MRGVVGRAEMRLGFLPERSVVKTFAGVPAAIVAAFGIGRDYLQRFAETELEQNACGVGGNLNTGAHLAERSGLLVELRIDAALAQRHTVVIPPYSRDTRLQTGHGLSGLRELSRYVRVLPFGQAASVAIYFAPAASRIVHHRGIAARLRSDRRRHALRSGCSVARPSTALQR